MIDPIEKQDALDVIKRLMGDSELSRTVQTGLHILPPAQPERQHGRIFQEIVVEYPSYNTYLEYEGKPYFSIKYTENGQEFIGYGTYNPEVLSEYLKEYFLPSAQPEIIRCKDCKYCKHWYAGRSRCFLWHEDGIGVFGDGFCNYAERRTDERSD